MSFEVVKGLMTMKVDFVTTTAIAAVLWLIGLWARKKFPVLYNYCIPAPVIGGILFAMIAWALRANTIMAIELNTMLQTPFQLIFFTTIGIAASLSLITRGGSLFVRYLVFGCFLVGILQNLLGVLLANLIGVHPVLGVMAGAVSLAGGPANAMAFGPMAESAGVVGATTVAMTSAVYGILVSGFIGGPLSRWIISYHHVPLETIEDKNLESLQSELDEAKERDVITSNHVVSMLTMILVMMVIGQFVSGWIKSMIGFDLPGYVGGMFVAIIFRNINDHFKMIEMSYKSIDLIGDICLGLFLTIAMMNLKIWELANLALPLLFMLVMQTIFCVAFCVWPLFYICGKNFDSAVIMTGMIGHNLGVAANTVANMDAVCRRYNVWVTKAFIIVPLCGAVLVDVVNIPNIVWFINFFSK